jgi:hypothetical protein
MKINTEFNPFTGEPDLVRADINQVQIGDADTYFKWVAPDTLQLWVNGSVAQSWTVTPVTPTTEGQPMGLLLTLTYPA